MLKGSQKQFKAVLRTCVSENMGCRCGSSDAVECLPIHGEFCLSNFIYRRRQIFCCWRVAQEWGTWCQVSFDANLHQVLFLLALLDIGLFTAPKTLFIMAPV